MRSQQLYSMLIAKEIKTFSDFPSADTVATTQNCNNELNNNDVLILLREIYAEIQLHINNGGSDKFIQIKYQTTSKVLNEVTRILRTKGFKCKVSSLYIDWGGENNRDIRVSWK